MLGIQGMSCIKFRTLPVTGNSLSGGQTLSRRAPNVFFGLHDTDISCRIEGWRTGHRNGVRFWNITSATFLQNTFHKPRQTVRDKILSGQAPRPEKFYQHFSFRTSSKGFNQLSTNLSLLGSDHIRRKSTQCSDQGNFCPHCQINVFVPHNQSLIRWTNINNVGLSKFHS